jgi:hypothetical protein
MIRILKALAITTLGLFAFSLWLVSHVFVYLLYRSYLDERTTVLLICTIGYAVTLVFLNVSVYHDIKDLMKRK